MSVINGSLFNPSTTSVSIPSVERYAITLANTEQNKTLPTGIKYFMIQNAGNCVVKIAYSSGQSNTNYYSLYPNCHIEKNDISTSASIDLYIQSPGSNQILEISTWS